MQNPFKGSQIWRDVSKLQGRGVNRSLTADHRSTFCLLPSALCFPYGFGFGGAFCLPVSVAGGAGVTIFAGSACGDGAAIWLST